MIIREAVTHGDAAWEEKVLIAFHRLSKTPWSMSKEPLQCPSSFSQPQNSRASTSNGPGRSVRMEIKTREIYCSANGDKWFPVRSKNSIR